jgi:hypothetical protein
MFNKPRDIALQTGKIAADRGEVRIRVGGGGHGQSLQTSRSNPMDVMSAIRWRLSRNRVDLDSFGIYSDGGGPKAPAGPVALDAYSIVISHEM